MSDVVAGATHKIEEGHIENNGATLLQLIREARVRINGAAKRKAEFSSLRRTYVVQWNFGGKTRNSEPAAAAWLYVRVTVPGGIIVEMRVAPDYPQPYTRVDVVQVCGVMGWKHEDEQHLESFAKSLNLNSISGLVRRIDDAVSDLSNSK